MIGEEEEEEEEAQEDEKWMKNEDEAEKDEAAAEEETGEEEEEGIRKFNILTLLLFNRAGRVLPSPSYKKLCHLSNFSVNLEMKHWTFFSEIFNFSLKWLWIRRCAP